jgi:hypothetical protein
MISVKYQGGLGNVLFQYCFGRVLAESLGYKLNASEVYGFPGTELKIDGSVYTDSSVVLGGHVVDVNKLIQNPPKSHIICDGYFMDYNYYKPFLNDIKTSWLVLDDEYKKIKKNNNDVVIHVRLGDYGPSERLSFSQYETILKNYVKEWDNLYICTDSPSDPFITQFQKYGAIIHSSCEDTWRNTPLGTPTKTTLEDFSFIMSFNRIVLSVSTFSWWTSVLSDASQLFYPLDGNFDPNNPWPGNFVIDESRTIFCDL